MASSHRELNPGHLWLEPPVLCHWATTTGQPPTLTILYVYCTGGTEMPRSISIWGISVPPVALATQVYSWLLLLISSIEVTSSYQERMHDDVIISCALAYNHLPCSPTLRLGGGLHRGWTEILHQVRTVNILKSHQSTSAHASRFIPQRYLTYTDC